MNRRSCGKFFALTLIAASWFCQLPVANGADFRLESNGLWRAIAPLGNLENQALESVGQPWEGQNVGWNSSLAYDDSNANGWGNSIPSDGGFMWGPSGDNTPSYFRTVLNLDRPVVSAFLDVNPDDDAVVWVNGVLVFYDVSGSSGSSSNNDITPFLVPGPNLIAVKAQDSSGGAQRIALNIEGVTSSTPNAATRQLLPAGSNWKYLDNGSNQGTAWRQPGFDDSSWASGPAQLGYGEGDEQTTISDGGVPGARHLTTYFRTTFEVGDPAFYENVALSLLRDDAAAVYVNGVEVLRSNLAANAGYRDVALGPVDAGGEQQWHGATFDPHWLKPGTNTIAVEVHQHNPASSDVSFDLALRTVEGRERIAYTTFNEPASGAIDYVPGPNGKELGFDTSITAQAGSIPFAGVGATTTTSHSPVFAHRSVTATTTFDPVDLTGWEDVTVSLMLQARQTGYEPGDVLDVYVTDGTNRVDLVSATASAIDPISALGYQVRVADIPDEWNTAWLVIRSSSNSSTDTERYDFDDIDFRGVQVVPEPGTIWLSAIGATALWAVGRGRRRVWRQRSRNG